MSSDISNGMVVRAHLSPFDSIILRAPGVPAFRYDGHFLIVDTTQLQCVYEDHVIGDVEGVHEKQCENLR